VYSRRIEEQILTLAPSGWTYDDVFVLYDRETQTLWYPYSKGLIGIQGPFYNQWLMERPSSDTRWKDWHEKHPDTKILN
jgi:hypothetical protein